MNKIWLIIQREVMNRVQKKSFLIATILLPLIFPAIMAVLVYVAMEQKKNAAKNIVYYVDESGYFAPDTSKFIFKKFDGKIEDAKNVFKLDDSYGLLYVPVFDLSDPKGLILYTKTNASASEENDFENMLENRIKELKMQKINIDQKILEDLKTNVSIQNVNIDKETGDEKKSDSGVMTGVGMAGGILMYMFIFIYGAQIMQGIIEEKTSKVVEVIVSSVKPFQLMMGKIIGLASVGLLQFLIWIVLITTVSSVVLGMFGLKMPQQQMMEQVAQQNPEIQQPPALEIMNAINEIPFSYIIPVFLFYFLGGYLLYGALFAAVGSAVDSPAEAVLHVLGTNADVVDVPAQLVVDVGVPVGQENYEGETGVHEVLHLLGGDHPADVDQPGRLEADIALGGALVPQDLHQVLRGDDLLGVPGY